MSIDSVVSLIGHALSSVISVVGSMLGAIAGSTELIVAGFSILIVVQLLINPLRGSGKSDKVGRSNKEKENDSPEE